MPHREVIWTPEIEAYIAQHGVTQQEVFYVLMNPIRIEPSRTTGNPIAFGFSKAGRHLAVVYEQIDAITVCPITAYDVEE